MIGKFLWTDPIDCVWFPVVSEWLSRKSMNQYIS
jgi:hypothetical protein